MIKLNPYENSVGFIELSTNKETSSFLDKLIVDNELTDAEKENFLEFLKNYNPKSGLSIKEHCETYFRDNKKFIGKTNFTGSPNTTFIRIKDVPRFKEWISQIVIPDVSNTIDNILDEKLDFTLRQLLFEQLLESQIKDDIINDTSSSFYFLGSYALTPEEYPILKEAKTDPWMVWSFPINETEKESILEKELNQLDCRAGLSEFKQSNKILYLHNTSTCFYIKRPTVFDAEFYDQFQPNGKTKPLEECKEQEGFDEFIHSPNKFKHIKELPKLIKKQN